MANLIEQSRAHLAVPQAHPTKPKVEAAPISQLTNTTVSAGSKVLDGSVIKPKLPKLNYKPMPEITQSQSFLKYVPRVYP